MNCLLFVVRFVFGFVDNFLFLIIPITGLRWCWLIFARRLLALLQLWSLLATLILVSSVLLSLSLIAFALHSSSFSFLNMKQYAAPAKLTFHCTVAQLSLDCLFYLLLVNVEG